MSALPCVRFADEEAHRRKWQIRSHGQPVRLSVETMSGDDGLVAITLTPLEGFVHLVQDPERCIREYGPYHVSVCQRSLVSDDAMDQLWQRWNDVETVLPIDWVSGEGCMELGKCPLTDDPLIRDLHYHPEAWYYDRPFHISG